MKKLGTGPNLYILLYFQHVLQIFGIVTNLTIHKKNVDVYFNFCIFSMFLYLSGKQLENFVFVRLFIQVQYFLLQEGESIIQANSLF